MPQDSQDLVIGFPLFHDADLLDVMAPLEALGFLQRPRARMTLVGPEAGKPVTLNPGETRVLPDAGFEDCSDLDVMIVPGGMGLVKALGDQRYVTFLRKHEREARYVVGVCAGALGLACVGLLNGHVATTHWAFLGVLGLFPEITVAPGYPRYVISGNRMTTGGVTSGLDMAIALCALLGGDDEARQVELLLQYAPRPPSGAGDPSVADPTTWAHASLRLETLRTDRAAFVRKLLG